MLAAGKSSAVDFPIQYTANRDTQSAREPECENARSDFDYGKAVRCEPGNWVINREGSTPWLPAANASRHVLDWNAATWEDRSQGTRPQPSVPASIRERSECERRQPTRSGTRSWFATRPWGLTSRRRVRVAKWPCLVHAQCRLAQSAAAACRPNTPALCRLVGGWRSEGAWRAREPQPERQVVLQTRIAHGREGALTRLLVSATLEGLRLPRVTMTRGSFEAWMKRLMCLWGVWCRLKEFPEA